MPCQFSNIVATQTFSSKTAALASTAVFTPTADGVFRVSLVLEAVVAGTVAANVSWTDGFNAQGVGSVASLDGAGNVITHTQAVAIRAKSGTSISVATVYTGGTYNLYVVVEQLI